jgi:selenocysteine lyase/cysteine desulfurase
VIATAADHNATLRPLHALATRGVIELSIVPCDAAGRVDPAAIAAAWRPATRFVVCSHVSNVTGAVQDVAAITAVAHERGGLVVLDAAQSLGIVPAERPGWGADVAVAPAHKWLLGTAGVAFLWAREGVEPAGILQGGTGSASESLEMPEAFAERLEPGTPDVPALAAAAAAAAWLQERGVAAVAAVGRDLADRAAAELGGLSGVTVARAASAAPIVSFTVEGYDPADVAAILEQVAGVQVRSGFHCAALVHEHSRTRSGGTVRASFGPSNTAADVEALVGAVAAVTRG